MKLLPFPGNKKLAAPPVSIECLACHGRYFMASLPIHQKSCFRRNAFVLVPCAKCKSCVRAGDLYAHIATCSGKALVVDRNSSGLYRNGAKSLVTLDQDTPMDVNLPEADGRVRCKLCERAFSQDRILKHQSVCHGKPRSLKHKQEA